jgi:outer membrane protein, heavy metal efflux system
LRRPEIDRLRAELERERVDRELARNQVLPGVDLGLGFTTEGGEGSVRRGPQEVKASLNFELPFQRRTARGSVLATEARIGQISQQRRFVEDQIRAEVRDASVALRAAFERVGLLGEEVGLTREVEEAERIRFQLGDSTLFLVNLRELATVDAEVREVAAQADYFRAVALYEYATAQTLP